MRYVVNLFKTIWGFIKGYLIIVGLLTTLTFASIVVFISKHDVFQSTSRDEVHEKPDTMEKPYLGLLELAGPLSYEKADFSEVFFYSFGLGKKHTTVQTLRRRLRRAASDDLLKGLLVRIGDFQIGPSGVSEMQDALADFKKSGKPIWVYANTLDHLDYQWASIADRIGLAPGGGLDLTGPAFSLTYMAQGLANLGVEFEVVRAGKYKSAFEPLIADKPSDNTLEMFRSMERDLRERLRQDLAANRGRDPAEVDKWLAKALITPQEAHDWGLIDHISYSDAFEDLFKEASGALDSVPFRHMEALDERAPTGEGRLAVIHASGEILMDGPDSRVERGVITPGALNKQLEWARKDDEIKGVLLVVDSPGGSALASDLIYEEVRKLVKVKPTVAFFGSVAASGGYYIASPATEIMASAGTITGSIGVLSGLANLEGFQKKFGVSFHVVTDSPRKNILDPGQRLSAEDRKLLTGETDRIYQLFIDRVAAGRGKDPLQISLAAEGRVYTGNQAQKIGLVDKLGSFQNAVARLKELAGLDPSRLYPLKTYEKEHQDLRECLASSLDLLDCLNEMRSTYTTLVTEADPAKLWLFRFHRMMKQSQGPLALWLPGIASGHGNRL